MTRIVSPTYTCFTSKLVQSASNEHRHLKHRPRETQTMNWELYHQDASPTFLKIDPDRPPPPGGPVGGLGPEVGPWRRSGGWPISESSF